MVLHEARFSDRLAQGRVLCTLCPHYCRISDGGRGACAVRYNLGGRLYTLVYDRVVAHGVDPIEKNRFFISIPDRGHSQSRPSGAICAVRSARIGR